MDVRVGPRAGGRCESVQDLSVDEAGGYVEFGTGVAVFRTEAARGWPAGATPGRMVGYEDFNGCAAREKVLMRFMYV